MTDMHAPAPTQNRLLFARLRRRTAGLLSSLLLGATLAVGLTAVAASPATTALAPGLGAPDAAGYCGTMVRYTGYLSGASSSGSPAKTDSNSTTVYGYITGHDINWSCNAFIRYSGITWNTSATLGTFDYGRLTSSTTSACQYSSNTESNPAILHANTSGTTSATGNGACPTNFQYPLSVTLTSNITYTQSTAHTATGQFSFVHTNCSTDYGAEPIKTGTNASTPNSNSQPGTNCDTPELDGTGTSQTFDIDTVAPPAPGYNTNNAANTYLPGPGSDIYFRNNTSGSFILTSVGTDTLSGAASNAFSALSATTGWTHTAGSVSGASSAKTLSWASGAASTSLTLTTTDKAGNTSPTTTVTLTADTTGPDISFSAPASTTQSTNTKTTTFTVEDAGAGTDTFNVYREIAALSNNSCGTFTTDALRTSGVGDVFDQSYADSWTAQNASAYCYRYRVDATDVLGNTSSGASNTVKYDPIAPGAPTITDGTSSTSWAYRNGNTIFFKTGSGLTLTLTSTGSDGESTIASNVFGTYTGINGTSFNGTVSGNPAVKTLTFWSDNAGGTLPIKSVDAAGNNGATTTITFTLDNTAPTTGAFTAPGSSIIQSATSYTYSWNPATDASGIANYHRVAQTAAITSPGVCDTTWTNVADRGNSSSTSINEPALGSGACYRMAVRAFDNVGNVSAWSYSPSILVDASAAGTGTGNVNISDDSATNPKVYRAGSTLWFRSSTTGSTSITIDGVDPESGVMTVGFNVLTGTTAGWSPTTALAGQTPGTSRTYSWTTAATGFPTLTGTATNGAAVTGSTSITLSPDALGPTAAFTAPASGTTIQQGAGVTVSFSGSDAGSGLANWSVQRQVSTISTAGSCTTGVTFVNDSGVNNLLSGTATAVQNSSQTLSDGFCYQWVLTATDNVGNVTTTTSGKILTDASAPSTPTLTSATGTGTFRSGDTIFFKSGASGSLTITAAAIDAQSGIATLDFGALTGGPAGWSPTAAENTSATGGSGSKTYTWSSGAANTTVTRAATNGSGLAGGSVVMTLTGDATAPTVSSSVQAGDTIVSSTGYGLSFTFSESGSGLAGSWNLQRQIGSPVANACAGASFVNDTTSGNSVSGTSLSSQSSSQTLANGSCYRWLMSATDNVGNALSATSGTVLVDTTAPVSSASVSSGTAGSNGWYTTNAGVTLSATDAASGVTSTSYEIDGGSTVTYSGPFTVNTDGAHTITFRSTDAAGNVESNKSFTVKVDKLAPAAAFGAPTGTVVQGATSFDVSWTSSDPTSGVATRNLQRQSGASVSGACASVSFSNEGSPSSAVSPVHVTGLTTGTCYRWTLTVTDNAGNTSASITSGTLLIDSAAPDIAFTAPTADATQSGASTNVTWTESSAAGVASRSLQRQVASIAAPGECDSDWADSAAAVTSASPSSQTLPTTDRCYRWVLTVTDTLSRASTTTSAVIIYDATAPTTTATPSGTVGLAGFYTSSTVAVTLAAADTSSPISSIIYKINTGANVTYSGAFNVSGAGTHTVTFHAVDAAGNVESNKTLTIKIDAIAPVTTAAASGTAGASGWFTSNSVSVTLTPTDATSGVASTSYEVDGGTTATYGGAFAVAGEGTHVVTFRSTDAAGNVESNKSFTVKIDTTNPSTVAAITSGTLGGDGWYKSSVAFSLIGSDATSGIGSIKYTINGGSTLTYSSPVSTSVQGPRTIAFWSVDAAGNTESAGSFTFQIDSTAPASNIDAMPASVGDPALSIPYTASDAGSGMASVNLYTKLGGTAATSSGYALVGTYTSSPIIWTAPSDGVWHLYIRATDLAGNVEAAPSTSERDVTVDTTAPVTALARTCTTGTNSWCKGTASVTFTVTDISSTTTTYRIDGGSWAAYSGAFNISAQGTHTVDFTSTDSLGNVETTKSAQVKVDSVAPEGSATPSGTTWPNGDYATPVVVALAGTDATSGIGGITYKIDGASTATTYSSAFTVTGNGAHTVSFTVTDGAGNTSTDSIAFTVNLQTITAAANVNCYNPGAAGWCISAVTVSLSAEDSFFPVSSITYTVDGGAVQTYDGSAFWVRTSGSHTVAYIATNTNGVTATGTITFKLDVVNPVIITKLTGTGTTPWFRTATTVTFTLSDSSSGSGGPTATYEIDGGETTAYTGPFILSEQGNHVITYKVRDVAGRWASSFINVNVDLTVPVASIAPLPATSDSALLDMPLTINDAFGVVSSVQLYYSTSATALPSAYTAGPVFKVTSTTTSISWIDPYNGTVRLFARATDKAGNVQPFPASPQAITAVSVLSPIAGVPTVTTSVDTAAKKLLLSVNTSPVISGTSPYKTYAWYLVRPVPGTAVVSLGSKTTAASTLSVSCNTALPGSQIYYIVTDSVSRTSRSVNVNVPAACPSSLVTLAPYISDPLKYTMMQGGTYRDFTVKLYGGDGTYKVTWYVGGIKQGTTITTTASSNNVALKLPAVTANKNVTVQATVADTAGHIATAKVVVTVYK